MRNIRLGMGLIVGVGALALLMIFSVHQAQASEVNILADQNMTIGSTGQNVVVLQSLLQEMGFMSIAQGIPMGYFGSVTKAGLAQYQISQSIYPTSGYFGPETKAVMHQQFASRGWLSLLGW